MYSNDFLFQLKHLSSVLVWTPILVSITSKILKKNCGFQNHCAEIGIDHIRDCCHRYLFSSKFSCSSRFAISLKQRQLSIPVLFTVYWTIFDVCNLLWLYFRKMYVNYLLKNNFEQYGQRIVEKTLIFKSVLPRDSFLFLKTRLYRICWRSSFFLFLQNCFVFGMLTNVK